MKWGATVFLIFFAAFILLLIFNPNLSCFGKRVRSPFTPLLRRRRARSAEPPKKIQTTDYGFARPRRPRRRRLLRPPRRPPRPRPGRKPGITASSWIEPDRRAR
jgi:hypothetical protein